jgi:hypothetical protein
MTRAPGVLPWRGQARTRPKGFHGRRRSSGTQDDASVPSAGRVREMPMRREEEAERSDPIGPLDWRRILPYEPAVASDQLGWVGLEAARFRASPAAELHHPALTHHMLVLFARPPDALDLRYDGVTRHVPPPPARSRWCRRAARSGCA